MLLAGLCALCRKSFYLIYLLLLFLYTFVMIYSCFFFFFQAEDGIRDLTVTGVQTCALPICYESTRLCSRVAGPDEERVALLETTAEAVRSCTLCRLHSGRIHAVPGEGPLDANVFLIGEAPGREEDATGAPFVGSAGKILDKALAAARILRSSVFITNVVKCRPPANRGPRSDEIESCRPYLMTQIAAVRPKVAVTLGSTALKALLGTGIRLKDTP